LVSDSALHFSIGPLISRSFPNRDVARARIDQASATAKATLAEFDGTVLRALQEAESALTQYAHDLDENARLRTARDRSREAAGLQTRLARGGAVSSLEVPDVERTLASAEARSPHRTPNSRRIVYASFWRWEEVGGPVRLDSQQAAALRSPSPQQMILKLPTELLFQNVSVTLFGHMVP